jgi:hypothetical protein
MVNLAHLNRKERTELMNKGQLLVLIGPVREISFERGYSHRLFMAAFRPGRSPMPIPKSFEEHLDAARRDGARTWELIRFICEGEGGPGLPFEMGREYSCNGGIYYAEFGAYRAIDFDPEAAVIKAATAVFEGGPPSWLSASCATAWSNSYEGRAGKE